MLLTLALCNLSVISFMASACWIPAEKCLLIFKSIKMFSRSSSSWYIIWPVIYRSTIRLDLIFMNGVKKESGFKFWDLLESNFLNGFPCLRIRNTFTKVCKTLSDPVPTFLFCFNYPFSKRVFLGVFSFPDWSFSPRLSPGICTPPGAQNTVFQAPMLVLLTLLKWILISSLIQLVLFVATHLSSYLECKLSEGRLCFSFHHYDESSINIMTAT